MVIIIKTIAKAAAHRRFGLLFFPGRINGFSDPGIMRSPDWFTYVSEPICIDSKVSFKICLSDSSWSDRRIQSKNSFSSSTEQVFNKYFLKRYLILLSICSAIPV